MDITSIIGHSIKKSISYSEYRELIKELISQGESTSRNGDDALLNYSVLNDKRMNRLDKKTVLIDEIKFSLDHLKKKQFWLVLTEGWCGDAAQNLPYLNKIAEYTDQVDLKVVLRDKDPELMEQFLTNGGKAIPKLISLDEQNNVLFTWGPRPSVATKMVADYKAKHGVVDAELKKNLQLWYNKDKGVSLYADFIELLK